MSLASLLVHVFCIYAVTAIVASSHIAKPVRRIFRKLAWKMLPLCIAGKFVKYDTDMQPVLEDYDDMDLTVEREMLGYDAISCRQCVGVWVTALLWMTGWPFVYEIGCYGAAHFFVTQERA